jgi:hypothetical protein
MSELNNLASIVQTKLNFIADTFYTANNIDYKIVFRVTDSEQSFNDDITRMDFQGENISYTPILIKRVFATKQSDYVYGKYIETYRLEILSLETQKNDIEKIFDEYSYQENFNDYEIIEGVQIKKNNGKILFQGLSNAQSGTNKHFIIYNYEFTWNYIIGSMVKESSVLRIDNVEIEFVGIAYTNDKSLVPNIPFGNNTLAQTNGQVLQVTLPLVQGTDNAALKNQELFNDITNRIYNKTHNIQWIIDDYKTISFEAHVRDGQIRYNTDELIAFTITFERTLPRTVLTINGVTIPILMFMVQREYTLENRVTVEEMQSVQTYSAFSINIRVAHDHNIAVSRTLLNDIINNNIGTQYTIVSSTGTTNTITGTYACFLQRGIYQYEQTGEIIYEASFVKKV